MNPYIVLNFIGNQTQYFAVPETILISGYTEEGIGDLEIIVVSTGEPAVDDVEFSAPQALTHGQMLKVTCTNFDTFKTITFY